jgi:aryl-alcohol dehydrogenase-like predicted oxidoreductase
MASNKVPHILLGSGGGIVPTSTSEELNNLLKHLKTLPTTIYGIDTAAVYPSSNNGKSEALLGEAGIGNSGFVLDTKVLVFPPGGGPNTNGREKDGGSLSRANILRSSRESLDRLKVARVRCLYAHSPDNSTPAAETVGAFGEVLKAGEAEVVSHNPLLYQSLKPIDPLKSGECQTTRQTSSKKF